MPVSSSMKQQSYSSSRRDRGINIQKKSEIGLFLHSMKNALQEGAARRRADRRSRSSAVDAGFRHESLAILTVGLVH
jgi:hypothetical protein